MCRERKWKRRKREKNIFYYIKYFQYNIRYIVLYFYLLRGYDEKAMRAIIEKMFDIIRISS